MENKRYIHYGSSEFDPIFWSAIRNEGRWVKPRGGLWASPVGAERSWYEWCQDEHFMLDRLTESFTFTLSPEARVLELTPDNVWKLPVQAGTRRDLSCEEMVVITANGIDFEALAQQYDVLECSLSKYPSLYWTLYGWDCDCILVMTPEVIV